MTTFAIVSRKTITAVIRCLGSLRSTRGQWIAEGALPAARRRRSTHAPSGISTSPNTNSGRQHEKEHDPDVRVGVETEEIGEEHDEERPRR